MPSVPISNLMLVEAQDATGETDEIFAEIRQMLDTLDPDVSYQIAALSPATLASAWMLYRDFLARATLPQSLLFMIHYAISSAKQNQYDSARFKAACRSVSVEEAMLTALVSDLDSVKPERTREIIKFSLQCATAPHSLIEADYDRVREQGVTDEEMVEIMCCVGIAMYHNTFASAVKLGNPATQQFIED